MRRWRGAGGFGFGGLRWKGEDVEETGAVVRGVDWRRGSASIGSMVTAGEEDEGEGAAVFGFRPLVGMVLAGEDRG
ncbi:hypothetical protein HAX54_028733 [Datura stramonium]|uniref:Uncharacterized protein n=1 Tax=Datura stramonium TaxID=4076 RepID=A0ABS8Y782_DATST|nr:hypothetical protein [Datura stramonium]